MIRVVSVRGISRDTIAKDVAIEVTREDMLKLLDSKGVEYHKNIKTDKLRDIYNSLL